MCFVIVKTVFLLGALPFLLVVQKIHHQIHHLFTEVGSGDEYKEKDREATTQFKVAPAKNNAKETRRELLKHLQEKRSAKSSKRSSTDAQLFDITKQEIQLKRQALEKIEESEKKQCRLLLI